MKERAIIVLQVVVSLVWFWGGLWLLTLVSNRWWVDLLLSAVWVLLSGPILKRLGWFPGDRTER